jgi:hypothetical protein
VTSWRELSLIGGGGEVLACSIAALAAPRGLAVVFPGWRYTASMPLLARAAEVMLELGFDVLRVEYDYPARGATLETAAGEQAVLAGVRGDAEAVMRAVESLGDYRALVLVGKSLGTHALAHLVSLGADAALVWLTPPLAGLDASIAETQQRSLVVIGTADPHYDDALMAPLRARHRVLEIEDADHALEIAGDEAKTSAAHATWLGALRAFVTGADCATCSRYFDGYGSGGDIFPDEAWRVVDAFEHPVGTHGGHIGMTGVGRCRGCGRRASFTCSYGPGYTFTRE